MTIHWIYATKEAASDDELIILSLSKGNGEPVRNLDVIAEVEGSKSAFELQSDFDGNIHYFVEQGSRVQIGGVIACICTDNEPRPDLLGDAILGGESGPSSNMPSRFSNSALELLESLGIDPNTVYPDSPFVTQADVDIFLQSSRGRKAFVPVKVAFLGGSYGASLALEALSGDSSAIVIGLFDDKSNLIENFGVPIIGRLSKEEIGAAFKAKIFDEVLITVQANMGLRKQLLEMCDELQIPLHTAIHPNSSIAMTAKVGPGCIIMDQVRIGPEANLSRNVFVSGMVNIDHHTSVGENTTFGPGVFLSGCVTVGKDCAFGTSIGVESHVVIGDGCLVTSGCVIQSDLKDFHVAKSPSKPIVRPREQ